LLFNYFAKIFLVRGCLSLGLALGGYLLLTSQNLPSSHFVGLGSTRADLLDFGLLLMDPIPLVWLGLVGMSKVYSNTLLFPYVTVLV
jgi:predicted small integral membrane protein